MKKRRVIQLVGDAFRALKKNWLVIVPGLLALIAVWGGVLLMALTGGNILLAVIVGLLAVVAVIYFGIGGLGMAKEVAEKKKAKWKHIHQYASKFWLRYTGVAIVIFFIFLALGLIAWLLAAFARILGGDVAFWIAIVLLILIAGLIALLFILAPYMLLIRGKNVMDAINRSVQVTKKNYLAFLGVLIIFAVISLAVQAIIGFATTPLSEMVGLITAQVVQGLISVVIGAAQAIALMMFILERK